MANHPNLLPSWDDEEYKKYLEELVAKARNVPTTIWGYKTSALGIFSDLEEYTEPIIIPLEQDEYGVYGYKTLIKIPESPWFWSPNQFHHSEWVDNRLTAHVSPQYSGEYGIYATKDSDSLKEWYHGYASHVNYSIFRIPIPVDIFAVKIRAWGCVVEHVTGFRAEYAEIVEVLHGYR